MKFIKSDVHTWLNLLNLVWKLVCCAVIIILNKFNKLSKQANLVNLIKETFIKLVKIVKSVKVITFAYEDISSLILMNSINLIKDFFIKSIKFFKSDVKRLDSWNLV